MSNGIELWCPSVKAKVDKIKKSSDKRIEKSCSRLITSYETQYSARIKIGIGLWCPSLSFYRQLAIKACIRKLAVRETVAAVQKVLKRKLPTDNLPPTQWCKK